VGAAISWALNDLVYVDDAWQGVSGGRIATAGLVGVGSAVLSTVLYLAAIHQLHTRRVGDAPGLAQSLQAGLRAMPRAVGWMLLLSVGAMVTLVLLGVVVALAGPIGLLLLFALVFGGAWAWVKLSFLLVACVVPDSELNAVRASAKVSSGGRFWAVFGRLLLLATVIAFALSIPLGAFGGEGADLDEILVFDSNDNVELFHVGKFVEGIGLGGGALILLTSLPQVLTSVLTVSGTTNLYAQVHGRRRS